MASDVMTRSHQLIASDRVEGTAVRRPNGDMIGHIERLMIDKVTGKVSYAILSFGGFLGIGANLIPLPWGRLRYNTRFEAYELDIDDEDLKRAPSFVHGGAMMLTVIVNGADFTEASDPVAVICVAPFATAVTRPACSPDAFTVATAGFDD